MAASVKIIWRAWAWARASACAAKVNGAAFSLAGVDAQASLS